MPRYATWSRSSKGSPRLAYRRARWEASDLCASISSLRSLRSPVRRNSTNFARDSARSCAESAISEQRPAGDAREAHETVVGPQLVVVDHGFQDLRGQRLDRDVDALRDRRAPDDAQ